MKPPLSKVPLLPILVAMIIGILQIENGWVFFSLTVCALFGFAFFTKFRDLLIIVVAYSLGFLLGYIYQPPVVGDVYTNNTREVIAKILTVNVGKEYTKCDIEILTMPKNPRCRLTISSVTKDLYSGDVVRLKSKFKKPQNATFPDAFDNETYLRHQRISLTAFANSDDVSIIKRRQSPLSYSQKARNKLRAYIFASGLNGETIEFLTATLLGDDSLIDDSVRKTFSSAGLSHVLALSGLHVGIITLILTCLFFPLRFLNRKIFGLTIIAVLWVYAFVTGLSPSVVRAVVMATLLLFGKILQRDSYSLNSLCFAAILILTFTPYSIYSVGFQMSFLAVASILIFDFNPVSKKHKVLRFIVSLFSVSLVAMLGSAVVSMTYFHAFPVYFLLSNVLITPFLPLLLGLGLLVIVVSASGIDCHFLLSLCDRFYSVVMSISEKISDLPSATIDNIYLSELSVWLYIMFVVALGFAFHKKRMVCLLALFLTMCAFISSIFVLKPQYPDGELLYVSDYQSTNFIYRYKRDAYLISNVSDNRHSDIKTEIEFEYRDYLRKRGCDSLISCGDTLSGNTFIKEGNLFRVNNKNYIFARPNLKMSQSSDMSIDYLVLSSRLGIDIISLYKEVKPDTILLAKQLNHKLLQNYADTLNLVGIPFIKL